VQIRLHVGSVDPIQSRVSDYQPEDVVDDTEVSFGDLAGQTKPTDVEQHLQDTPVILQAKEQVIVQTPVAAQLPQSDMFAAMIMQMNADRQQMQLQLQMQMQKAEDNRVEAEQKAEV
jgi:hypothetical protein